MVPPIIGIDLGTTKSVVAVWKDGKPYVIPDRNGLQSIPSLVLVTENEKMFVGRMAQRHPDRYRSKNVTISSVKRLIGKKGETGWGWWRTYPQEVSALILAELKSQAEIYLGEKIDRAVIAIPSHFDESQRRATKEAAEIAGLEACRLLNEATAAILAYEFHRLGNRNTLVFDFGGGTLDISLADCGEGAYQVKCIEGDSKLGGDDFDQVIVDYALDKIHQEYGSSIELDTVQKMVLREAAEAAKISLSSTINTSIYIPGFLHIGQSHRNLEVPIDRLIFEQLSKSLIDRAMVLLKKALNSAGLKSHQVDSLLLLGGSSRIPFVRERIRKELGVEPAIGVDVETGVAQGAALWAAVMDGKLKELLLLDVIPSSYGIGLKGDIFSPIIPKNTVIPTSNSQKFTTTENNQSTITLSIYQGESEKTSENTFLSTIELRDILPAPAGLPQIEVRFDIDQNMIVNVLAMDVKTGKEQRITVKSPYGLNNAQIKLMQGRIKSWFSDRLISEYKSDITSIVSSIEIALSRGANALSVDKLAETRKACASLNQLITKGGTYEEFAKGLNSARAIYAETQQSLARYENMPKEISDLTVKIEKFVAFIEPFNTKGASLLTQGEVLLKDYIQRGLPYEELSKMLSAVRSTYEEALADLIKKELESLKNSEQMREWTARAREKLSNSDLIQQALLELRRIKEISSIIYLFESEDSDYRNAIQQYLLTKIKGDSYSEACFVLIVSAFLNQSVISIIKQISQNESNDILLAISLFNALSENKPFVQRITAAQCIVDCLPDVKYIAPVVKRISRGVDASINNILLDYIKKQPQGVFGDFIKKTDTETWAQVSGNKEMLLKLAGEPDEKCCLFALDALANFPAEISVPALLQFAHNSNPVIRVRTLEVASKSKSSDFLINELCIPALNDYSPEIRIRALHLIEQNKEPSSLAYVLSMLQSEQNEVVRETAVATLCSFNDVKIVPISLKLLMDKNQKVQALILDALERNNSLMDKDVMKLFKLIREAKKEKYSINILDSAFLWRFLKKHPEMVETVQTLKEANQKRFKP